MMNLFAGTEFWVLGPGSWILGPGNLFVEHPHVMNLFVEGPPRDESVRGGSHYQDTPPGPTSRTHHGPRPGLATRTHHQDPTRTHPQDPAAAKNKRRRRTFANFAQDRAQDPHTQRKSSISNPKIDFGIEDTPRTTHITESQKIRYPYPVRCCDSRAIRGGDAMYQALGT